MDQSPFGPQEVAEGKGQRNEAGKVEYGSSLKAFKLKPRFRLYVTGTREL